MVRSLFTEKVKKEIRLLAACFACLLLLLSQTAMVLADGKFRIPYTVQRLTIYGYVYNYSLTDPKVSYRLIGFDRRAVPVNRSELGPVTYTNLAGGTYSFVMELHDAMGRGNKTLRVSIEKEKALYEQTWFFIMVGVLLSGIIYAIVRLYIDLSETLSGMQSSSTISQCSALSTEAHQEI